ncbi:MAG: serine hydrolase [Bacteroidota bacterium]
MKKIITTIFLAYSMGFYVSAQTSAFFADSLQYIIEQQANENGFIGFSAAAIFPDGSIWQGATGMAADGVTLDSSMIFNIASVSKNMLATLILKLEEEGSLNLNDSVGMYVSPFPHVDGNITIRQLLNHTSGLSDLEETAAYEAAIFDDLTYQWPAEELLNNFQNTPLGPPGSPYEYSNSNYILLVPVAEAATGKTLENLFREKIFEPLDMMHTWSGGFETPSAEMGGLWADFNGDGSLDDLSTFPLVSFLSSDIGAGHILSKPSDMVQYAQTIYEGEFLSENSLLQMLEPAAGSAVPPFTVGYGLGTQILDLNGHPFVGHEGASIQSSLLYYNPVDHFGVALCTNHLNDLTLPFLNLISYIGPNLGIVPTDENNKGVNVNTFVFPNPFSYFLNFEINSADNAPVILEIYDQLGKQIFSHQSDIGNHHLIQWDGNDLRNQSVSSGVYFYRIKKGGEILNGILQKI